MIDETTYNSLMSKNGQPEYVGQGLRAPAWTGVGVLILDAVTKLLGNGGIGGRQDCATQRDLDYERKLTEANADKAALQAKYDCQQMIIASERRYEDKFDAIEAQIGGQQTFNAKMQGFMETLAGQVASFDRMTARYIVQPVMAASEGALAYGPFAKASAAASGAAATAG